MLLRWRPSIRQHPCQGWHKSWSIGWMPNVLCELLGAGQSSNKWLLMKYSVCPVTACIIAYYDKLCWWCIHYFTLLHIITFDIFACYYMLLQWSLLHCYYIFLHCYYLLLHLSLLPVITDSLLHIITSLLRHYCIIITSLCNLENSCNNGFIITYYYIDLFHYYIIITHYVIISHYYLLLTGQLADADPHVSKLTFGQVSEYFCFQDLICPSSHSKAEFLALAAQTGKKRAIFGGV